MAEGSKNLEANERSELTARHSGGRTSHFKRPIERRMLHHTDYTLVQPIAQSLPTTTATPGGFVNFELKHISDVLGPHMFLDLSISVDSSTGGLCSMCCNPAYVIREMRIMYKTKIISTRTGRDLDNFHRLHMTTEQTQLEWRLLSAIYGVTAQEQTLCQAFWDPLGTGAPGQTHRVSIPIDAFFATGDPADVYLQFLDPAYLRVEFDFVNNLWGVASTIGVGLPRLTITNPLLRVVHSRLLPEETALLTQQFLQAAPSGGLTWLDYKTETVTDMALAATAGATNRVALALSNFQAAHRQIIVRIIPVICTNVTSLTNSAAGAISGFTFLGTNGTGNATTAWEELRHGPNVASMAAAPATQAQLTTVSLFNGLDIEIRRDCDWNFMQFFNRQLHNRGAFDMTGNLMTFDFSEGNSWDNHASTGHQAWDEFRNPLLNLNFDQAVGAGVFAVFVDGRAMVHIHHTQDWIFAMSS